MEVLVKVKKVKELIDQKKINPKDIIDIRESYEIKSGKINGSRNIPMNRLLNHPEKFLDKNKTYYLICQSGSRSFSTYVMLKFKKYTLVIINNAIIQY